MRYSIARAAATMAVILLAAACTSVTSPAAITPSPTASSPDVTSPHPTPSRTPPATLSATPAGIAPGAWTATTNMAVARSGHTATLLPDGRVLVVGGGGEDTLLEGGPRSPTAESFDPGTATWSAAARMIEARVWHSATLLLDGSVLVVGGSGGLREAELFHPSTGEWIATGSTSTPQGSGHTATLLADGRVLVAGGNPGSEFDPLATAELYNPDSGRWTATASMATARSWHTATLLPDGRVLVVGGGSDERGEQVPSATAELYDPSSGRWTATATMTTGRLGHTATLLPDGKVLVAGGDPGDGTIAQSAELYDPSSGSWTATGSLTEAHGFGHTATLLPDGTVLVAGGSAELYDLSVGRWTTTDKMTDERYGHTATLLADGTVLVAGGFRDSDGLGMEFWASAALYHPTGGS